MAFWHLFEGFRSCFYALLGFRYLDVEANCWPKGEEAASFYKYAVCCYLDWLQGVLLWDAGLLGHANAASWITVSEGNSTFKPDQLLS